MNVSLYFTSNPLQYQNHLLFPYGIEQAYREDYASCAIKMQRHFIAFGFVLYGLFSILDYYAMPRTHHTAWLLRVLLEPLVAGLFCITYKQSWQQKIYWLLNLSIGRGHAATCMIGQQGNHHDYIELLIKHSTSNESFFSSRHDRQTSPEVVGLYRHSA